MKKDSRITWALARRLVTGRSNAIIETQIIMRTAQAIAGHRRSHEVFANSGEAKQRTSSQMGAGDRGHSQQNQA